MILTLGQGHYINDASQFDHFSIVFYSDIPQLILEIGSYFILCWHIRLVDTAGEAHNCAHTVIVVLFYLKSLDSGTSSWKLSMTNFNACSNKLI